MMGVVAILLVGINIVVNVGVVIQAMGYVPGPSCCSWLYLGVWRFIEVLAPSGYHSRFGLGVSGFVETLGPSWNCS